MKFKFKSMAESSMIRAASALGSIFIAFFISLKMGNEIFGIFTFVVSSATLISILAKFGLDIYYIKNRPAKNNKQFIFGYLVFISINSIFLTIFLLALTTKIYPISIDIKYYFWILLFSILYAYLGVLSLLFKVRGKYSLSSICEPIFLNVLLSPVIFTGYIFNVHDIFFLFQALLISLLALLLGFLLHGDLLIKIKIIQNLKTPVKYVEYFKNGIPYFKATFMGSIQNFIIIFSLSGISMSDVGLYRLIERTGMAISFLLGVVNIAAPVRFKMLLNLNKNKDLINEVGAFSFVSGLWGLILFVIILISNYFFNFPFAGADILLFTIYGFSQMINSVSGPLGNLLLVSGNEKFLYMLNFYIFIFLLIAAPLSVNSFSLYGAVALISIVTIFSNALVFIRVHYIFNFWALPNLKAAFKVFLEK
jgi:O-antigen/teichoic acid export membrane protein